MAPGVHHLSTSRGQKANGNVNPGEGAFASCVVTDDVTAGLLVLELNCLRLFAVFLRLKAAFARFVLRVFVILGNALQRGAFRCIAVRIHISASAQRQ